MCVDSANCGGNCTERQHDTIKHLRVRIAELEQMGKEVEYVLGAWERGADADHYPLERASIRAALEEGE